MPGPESKFQTSLLKKLRSIPHSWWVKISQRTIRGTPDVIGCVRCGKCGDGKIVALELKTDVGKPDKLQGETLRQIFEAGGYANICRPKVVDAVLEDLRRLILKEPD